MTATIVITGFVAIATYLIRYLRSNAPAILAALDKGN